MVKEATLSKQEEIKNYLTGFSLGRFHILKPLQGPRLLQVRRQWMNFMCRGEKKKCDLDLPRVSACGKVKDSAPDYGVQRLQTQRFYPQ